MVNHFLLFLSLSRHRSSSLLLTQCHRDERNFQLKHLAKGMEAVERSSGAEQAAAAAMQTAWTEIEELGGKANDLFFWQQLTWVMGVPNQAVTPTFRTLQACWWCLHKSAAQR